MNLATIIAFVKKKKKNTSAILLFIKSKCHLYIYIYISKNCASILPSISIGKIAIKHGISTLSVALHKRIVRDSYVAENTFIISRSIRICRRCEKKLCEKSGIATLADIFLPRTYYRGTGNIIFSSRAPYARLSYSPRPVSC